ncbi:MAG: hypothetical protein DRR06_12635 [Gammaproteobacteria bacterium]|nr:MAG: hypothetical protein DRR06_12635 [Gammaproteobacteria bacterium]
MRKIKLIIIVLAILVAVSIGAWVVQDNPLETNIVLFGFSTAELPVGLWVLVFFLSGMIIGVALSYPRVFSLKRQSKRAIKTQQKLESELVKKQEHPVTE